MDPSPNPGLFTEEQIAVIEDLVVNLVQRPLHVLREVASNKSVPDILLFQSLNDVERLIAWVRSLR